MEHPVEILSLVDGDPVIGVTTTWTAVEETTKILGVATRGSISFLYDNAQSFEQRTEVLLVEREEGKENLLVSVDYAATFEDIGTVTEDHWPEPQLAKKALGETTPEA